MPDTIVIHLLLSAVSVLLLIYVAIVLRTLRRDDGALDRALREEMARAREEAARSARELREEVAGTLHRLGGDLRTGLTEMAHHQNERLDAVRTTVDSRLEGLRKDNEAKLEAMRQTVDEKLHATLEQRLGEKFGLVGQQLERVHQSVGEMQALAAGVGDLKRVLTNVKARGTWGEVSLGGLLDQVMTADQVSRNVEVQPGSGERVEFAVKLPGRQDEGEVWLPIDAKFPVEDYERLVAAADLGDKAAEELALRGLENRIRKSAQDICAKYVHPPHSTDFAIMYLPTEGLYAEVLRRPGLVETMNRECRVVPAGPTTLTAMLNSLQMGFRTLAIEKRSSEVWQLLAAVKTEFGKYGEVLDKVQRRLQAAEKDIASVRIRERAIGRRLRGVEQLPETEAGPLLQLSPAPTAEEETEEVDG